MDKSEHYYLVTLINGEQYHAGGVGIGMDYEKGELVGDRIMVDFYEKNGACCKKYPIEEVGSIIHHPSGEPCLIFEGNKERGKKP